ncbi:HEAT repeat domain-containing protein [Myxococcota bacterium]|nr:HEAT repeat domain-containing protein [Myxococcota bacterium]MBU1429837.1 HEAT repeat domain-containing protein [Myxococcota bacterium]MBU1897749.1 HEAT repeat domain-containing protein [Myxococcota bacterium]
MRGRTLLVFFLAISAIAWSKYNRHSGDNAARIAEVLKALPTQPDVLINVDPSDLPATADIIRLGKRATPAIINGLVNSMDAQVRGLCAEVLVATRDPQALEALMDALEDPQTWIQSLAIKALGQVESEAVAPRLIEFMNKKSVPGHLKREAISALSQLGDPRVIPVLFAQFMEDLDGPSQEALWNLRRQLTPQQIEQMTLTVLEPRASYKRAPYNVIQFGVERARELKLKAAVPHLIRLFDEQSGLRNRLIFALGHIGDPAALPFLKGLLDKSAEARQLNNVLFAIQRLGEDPTPFVQAALKDRRAYIRFNAAYVAGDLKLKSVVPDLITALSDLNDYVRSETAVALGHINDPRAVEALEAASREKNPVVRRDALLALAEMDLEKHRARVWAELLASPRGTVRDKAARFLAARGDRASLPTLISALDPNRYDDRHVGLSLLNHFWKLDNADAIAFLLRIAADGGDRHEALRLLARFRDPRALFVLRQWLVYPQGEQDQLLRAMGRYRDEAAKPLAERWLSDEDAYASQLHAAYLLARLGDPRGNARLVDALEKAPLYLKRAAARLMTELEAKEIPTQALHALLKHEDVYVRAYAARGLIEHGDTVAMDALEAELKKKIPFIRDVVLDVMERTPDQIRAQIIARWLPNADPYLAQDLLRIQARNAPDEG